MRDDEGLRGWVFWGACLGRVVPHPLRQALLGLLVAQGQLGCRVQRCMHINLVGCSLERRSMGRTPHGHAAHEVQQCCCLLSRPLSSNTMTVRPACYCTGPTSLLCMALAGMRCATTRHTCRGVTRRHILPSDHVHFRRFVLGIGSTLCWLAPRRGLLTGHRLRGARLWLCWACLACSASLGGIWRHTGACFLQRSHVQLSIALSQQAAGC